MKTLNVYYEVVGEKFFVRLVRNSIVGNIEEEEIIFRGCDTMVDYYRTKFKDFDKVNFHMINPK